MKKFSIIALAALSLIGVSSCGNDKLSQEEERNHRLDDSLQIALANSDSLFSLLYDVTTGMEQITQLEKLMATEISPESASARETIASRMAAIQRGLIERRQRIEELEKKLGSSAGENSKLRTQLTALRDQIDKQAAAVADLTTQLENAHIEIATLTSTVDSLNSTVDTITQAAAQTQRKLDQAVVDLNSVYYVIGTKDELKEHNFIEGGGFLRKTKVLESDFDENYMTRVDRRTFKSLPLDSKKAKVLTKQPVESYEIAQGPNGMLTLRILDPARFWGVSNILVIQTN